MFRRFIFRLGFRSGFTHTKTTKCELASLKQHILLNVFAHINLFPTSTKCRQIESPKRLKFRVASAEASLLDYAESREIS